MVGEAGGRQQGGAERGVGSACRRWLGKARWVAGEVGGRRGGQGRRGRRGQGRGQEEGRRKCFGPEKCLIMQAPKPQAKPSKALSKPQAKP